MFSVTGTCYLKIKQYILTLKQRQEIHDVINRPLKQALYREIKLCGNVLDLIQTERSSPRIQKLSLNFGFSKEKMKYRQPDFVCPFYCKGKRYWYYDIYISVRYLNRPLSCHYHLGKSFEGAVTKLKSVWNLFLKFFT